MPFPPSALRPLSSVLGSPSSVLRLLFSVLCLPSSVLLPALPVFAGQARPNASRECAICHIRWVDAFEHPDATKETMPAIMERQAGSGDMCLSCHDGSVADSRFKVWSTHHHTTGIAPSADMHIPTDTFPLDAQGHITCATCHTAHAVPGTSDIRTVVFLRQPNVDSSLCLACHGEHARKNAFMHPLGHSDAPISEVILAAGGKTAADGHTIICQTCHEPHGARNDWMLVLPPSELCVACHTDKSAEFTPEAGAPVHHIGRTYPGFSPPTSLIEEKAGFGPNGELSCLSCHRLHDASGAWPLLIRNNQDSGLCLECHEQEASVLDSPHDLRVSSPDTLNASGQTASTSGPCGACHRVHGWGRDVPDSQRAHSSACLECHNMEGPGGQHRPYIEAHPVGVSMPADANVPLPLDTATRRIGCMTCHEPHSPRAREDRPDEDLDSQVRAPRSFLRKEGSQLCVICHEHKVDSLRGAHDPALFSQALRESLNLHPSVGACRVCHTTHNAQGVRLWARKPLDSPLDPCCGVCGACHLKEAALHKPQGTYHPLRVAPPVSGDPVSDSSTSVTPRSVSENPVVGPRASVFVTGKDGEAGDIGVYRRYSRTQSSHKTSRSKPDRILRQAPKGCALCHNPHGGADPAFQLDVDPEQLCQRCHQDKLGIRHSVHDPNEGQWVQRQEGKSRGPCLDCHPIHRPPQQGDVWQAMGGEGHETQVCEVCHHAAGPGKAVVTPHVGKVQESPGSESSEPVVCTSCHDIHQQGAVPFMLKASRQDALLCRSCHADTEGVMGTQHDLRVSAPKARNIRNETASESGPCGACHFIHSVSDRQGTWAQPFVSETTPAHERCTGCHRPGQCAAKRVPKYTDHPEVPLVNRSPSDQNEPMPTYDTKGNSSKTGVISCLTCHTPHGRSLPPEPPNQDSPLNSRFLRPDTHQRLCSDCHGKESLWRYLYYHQKQRHP